MNRLLRRVSVGAFKLLDRVGLHVLPKHYYTPVADQLWLSRHKSVWAKRAPMTGVRWDLNEQFSWLRRMCEPFYTEVAGLHAYNAIARSEVGPGYGAIESQVLHCVVRNLKPRRIVEIGSGTSTAVMLRAIEENVREGTARSDLTCIEPFPKPAFRSLVGITHVEQICQSAPRSLFHALESGDLLFIDSSHALKTGSDLSAIYLDVVPALKRGVVIHIHDIFLPYVYSPSVLEHYFDWQETALVLALLTHNPKLEVRCGLAALQYDRATAMQELLTDFKPRPMVDGLNKDGKESGHYVSSLWLETC